MRTLAPALIILTLLVPATRAEAAPILFNFTVDMLIGPLGGQDFPGTFSVEGDDCPGGVCNGTFDSDGPTTCCRSISRSTATLSQSAPVRPSVTFNAGAVVALFYNNGAANLPFLGINDLGSTGVTYQPSATGSTTIGGVVGIAPAVPEPATMLLVGVGLTSLGARRWRQHRHR